MRLRRELFTVIIFFALRDSGRAGAALWPANTGQVIESLSVASSARSSNQKSDLLASWRKTELASLVEYGATDRITLVADATFGALATGVPTSRHVALEPSELGARVGLWSSATDVFSAQATLRTPTLPAHSGSLFAGGPSLGADARLLYAHSFDLRAMTGFFEVQAGYRLNGDGWRGVAHLDLTLGFRPRERFLILLQSFGRLSQDTTLLRRLATDDKAQVSLVYDISARWSAQIGAFMSIVGSKDDRQRGALLGIWRRF